MQGKEFLDNLPIAFCQQEVNKMTPSFDELQLLASIKGVEIVDVVAKNENAEVVGRLLCCVCVIVHHHVKCRAFVNFDGNLHDYSPVCIQDEIAARLLEEEIVCQAKMNCCDLILIRNVVAANEVKFLREKADLKIFDARKEAEGWKAIYNRRSIKRFRSLAKKRGDYRVEVYDGRLTYELISRFGEFHKKRWHYAGARSAFDDPRRVNEYLCFAENKHLLCIYVGDEILAAHYGMKYNDAMLWHSPVINTDMLDLSPLRLLLGETARYCEDNGFHILDFGLGDESYKDGYCNEERITRHLTSALTIKGCLSLTVGWFARMLKSRWGLIRKLLTGGLWEMKAGDDHKV